MSKYIRMKDNFTGETNVVDEKEASYKIKRVYALPGETFEEYELLKEILK